MFVATLGIALSLTLTFLYLTLYPISDKVCRLLDLLDFIGKVTMIFLFTFAVLASELAGSAL